MIRDAVAKDKPKEQVSTNEEMTSDQFIHFTDNFNFMMSLGQYDTSQFEFADEGIHQDGGHWQRYHGAEGKELVVWAYPDGSGAEEIKFGNGESISAIYDNAGNIKERFYSQGLFHKKIDFNEDGSPRRVLTWKYTSEHSLVTIYEWKGNEWTWRLSSK